MIIIFDILLLLIAIFAIWKLRSLLGKRTGFERTEQIQPFQKAENPPNAPKKIMPAPARAPFFVEGEDIDDKAKKAIVMFHKQDSNFSIKRFLEGAQRAYKIIVEAFANGDMETLKPLLKRNMATSFQAEIERRKDKNYKAHARITKMTKAKIISAALKKSGNKQEARITIEMESHQLAWTEDSEGRIISGDPKTPRHMKDIWVFARDLGKNNPNWLLMASGN